MKNLFRYNENQNSDSLDDVVDLDSGEVRSTKKGNAQFPNADVIMKLFPNYQTSWKINRSFRIAAENVFKVRGLKDASDAMAFAVKFKDDEFCPKIDTPYDLDMKWDKLVAYSIKKS